MAAKSLPFRSPSKSLPLLAWRPLHSPATSACYHTSQIRTITFKMPSVYQTLILLLIFITSCSGSPFVRRQTNVSSLISCASASLRIDQFTTFSGNADTTPHITFFLMNPNPGAPGRMLCTATLGSGEGNFVSSSFYSCEVSFGPRYVNNTTENMLTNCKGIRHGFQLASRATQSIPVSNLYQRHCEVSPLDPLLVDQFTNHNGSSPSRQIVIAAQGVIATTSYPGEHGGEYTESITGSDSIPILRVEDAQSLNRGAGRAVDENVMCGHVGPSNVVYSIGPCNLTAPVPGLKL
jgi:hypothetical protein